VAATLWIAPHASLDTSSRALHAKSVVITMHLHHVPAIIADAGARLGSHLAAGVGATGIFFYGLVLLGLVGRAQSRLVPALARPTRRGRAPPPPADPRWNTATRRR
jgi:hypothetical protein